MRNCLAGQILAVLTQKRKFIQLEANMHFATMEQLFCLFKYQVNESYYIDRFIEQGNL